MTPAEAAAANSSSVPRRCTAFVSDRLRMPVDVVEHGTKCWPGCSGPGRPRCASPGTAANSSRRPSSRMRYGARNRLRGHPGRAGRSRLERSAPVFGTTRLRMRGSRCSTASTKCRSSRSRSRARARARAREGRLRPPSRARADARTPPDPPACPQTHPGSTLLASLRWACTGHPYRTSSPVLRPEPIGTSDR